MTFLRLEFYTSVTLSESAELRKLKFRYTFNGSFKKIKIKNSCFENRDEVINSLAWITLGKPRFGARSA